MQFYLISYVLFWVELCEHFYAINLDETDEHQEVFELHNGKWYLLFTPEC